MNGTDGAPDSTGSNLMDGDYVGVDEAARILEVHPNTVRNKMKRGQLAYHKVLTVNGAVYRIPRAALAPTVPVPMEAGGPRGSTEMEVVSEGGRLEQLLTAVAERVGTTLREEFLEVIQTNTQMAGDLATERTRLAAVEAEKAGLQARVQELEGLLTSAQQQKKRWWQR